MNDSKPDWYPLGPNSGFLGRIFATGDREQLMSTEPSWDLEIYQPRGYWSPCATRRRILSHADGVAYALGIGLYPTDQHDGTSTPRTNMWRIKRTP